MASLEYGQQTEEQVCQAIEAAVCRGLADERKEEERQHFEEYQYPTRDLTEQQYKDKLEANKKVNQSVLQKHFEDLGKHYANLADYDPYIDRQKPEGGTTDTKK